MSSSTLGRDLPQPAKTSGKTEMVCSRPVWPLRALGVYCVAARHEWVKSREQISDADYHRYFDHFDPDLYDPSAFAARAAAMR